MEEKKSTASSQSNLPVRLAMIGTKTEAIPVAPIPDVITATFITPATPTTSGRTVTSDINNESIAHSIPNSVDCFQVEEAQDISAALDECLQEYATNRDDAVILVKTIKIIKDDLPFTSLGLLKYTRFFFRLSLTLWTYKSLGAAAHSVDNLESVLALTEEVLSLSSIASPTWITYCIALVWLCNRRLTMDKNTITAVERYIIMIEKFMPIAASNSLLKHNSAIQVIIRRLLGNLHSLQYDWNSMMEHLNNAITFQRSAISQDIETAQEDRDTYYDLGMLLCLRYERTGIKVDISECIEMLRIYCNLTPKSALDRAIGLSNLAYAINLCFKTGMGQTKDLDEALEIVQEALHIMEKSYPKIVTLRGEMLTNLGNILFRRYEALCVIEDLEIAIDASRKSLDQPDISNDMKAARCNNLAYRLKLKYERMKHFSSIEEGILITMQAFSIRTLERQNICLLLNTMVGLLVERCRRDTGSKVDWDRAVRFAKIAVGSEPSLPSRIPYMQTLSAVLTERYEKFHDEKDLAEAIDYGLKCLRSTKVSHPLRSTFLTGVGSRFSLRYNRTNSIADLDCALGLHQAAVQLNPSNEIAVNNFGVTTMNRWFATKNEIYLQLAIDRMESVYQSPTFSNFGRVRGATAAGALSMELEDYTRASILLKGAVSLLPELYLPLIDRKDLQHVLSQLSELPERVASALLLNDNQSVVDALNLMESSRGIISSLTMKAKRNNNMATQTLIHTNSNIAVDAKSYMKLAEYGSIVSFVVSNRKSSAIIITAQGIKCIDLQSLNYNHLRSEAIEYLATPDFAKMVMERCRKTDTKKPGIDCESCFSSYTSPNLVDFQRPYGSYAVHAAGDHTHGSTENTISHVVSSYAPTLNSLRYSRQGLDHLEKGRNLSVTIVAMAQTENRKPLNVEPEITAIKAAFPQTTILRTPTTKMTLGNMQTCNIGHFICRGYSDPQDPSKSGLVLSSGSLTLEDLSQHFFPNAHIAYLSACSTAKTSTRKLVDEVQHLGSGFQLAGFPHAIATRGRLTTKIAAKVPSDFYDGIKGINGSYLKEGIVARALHGAVKRQRDKLLDDPIAWAAQVHFDP